MNVTCASTLHLSRLFLTPLLVIALAVAGAVPAHAGDDDEKEVDAHHHHAPSARHVSAFVGGTSVAGHTSLTIGAEAAYRLPVLQRRVGVGALVDATLGTYSHTIVGGMMLVRPVPGLDQLKIVLAPSAEFSHGHSKFLMRTGVGYDVHVQAMSISPMLDFDFVDGHVATVFGVALGVGF